MAVFDEGLMNPNRTAVLTTKALRRLLDPRFGIPKMIVVWLPRDVNGWIYRRAAGGCIVARYA